MATANPSPIARLARYGVAGTLARYALAALAASGLLAGALRCKTGAQPLLASQLAGAFLIYAVKRPGARSLLRAALGGLVFAVGYALLGGKWPGAFVYWPLVAGAFFGLGGLLMALVELLWSAPGSAVRREAADSLFAVGVLPLLLIATFLAHGVTRHLHPMTYDRFLYAFDGALGLQPGYWLGRLFAASPPLAVVSNLVYVTLPLPAALLYISHLRARDGSPELVLRVFLGIGVAGFFLYQICPATGPVYAFGNFPFGPPVFSADDLVPAPIRGGFLNAMPSLHVAWALALLWNCRPGRAGWRAAAALYLFFTVLATLGTGEHYLADLVAAFPFTLAIQAACATSLELWSPGRRGALLFGGVAALAWPIALRTSLPSLLSYPRLAWTLAGATVLAAVIFAGPLLQAQSGRAQKPTATPECAEAISASEGKFPCCSPS